MSIEINDKTQCSGCWACYNICPHKCISMDEDEQGFKYPLVNKDECIECSLCENVCPMHHIKTETSMDHDVYAAWSKNDDIRFTSTSGRAFSELAYSFLDTGGLVVGAAYREDNTVEHVLISDRNGVEKIRQSKYVQSNINLIYDEIKKSLQRNTSVLFCGAPCQVAGLKGFLGKDYDNLVTVDFICRGMNSPKAYYYWLKELEDEYKSKVTKVWFKYKVNGWKRSPRCTHIDFENGETCVADGENNYFMQGYLNGNLYLRPSCSKCLFKGDNRYSDITLADFWKVSGELDDDKGTSLVMINTSKGWELFSRASKNMVVYKRSFSEINEGNVCFNNSAELNPKSTDFLAELGSRPFSQLVKQYTKVPIYRKILRKVKEFLK